MGVLQSPMGLWNIICLSVGRAENVLCSKKNREKGCTYVCSAFTYHLMYTVYVRMYEPSVHTANNQLCQAFRLHKSLPGPSKEGLQILCQRQCVLSSNQIPSFSIPSTHNLAVSKERVHVVNNLLTGYRPSPTQPNDFYLMGLTPKGEPLKA